MTQYPIIGHMLHYLYSNYDKSLVDSMIDIFGESVMSDYGEDILEVYQQWGNDIGRVIQIIEEDGYDELSSYRYM